MHSEFYRIEEDDAKLINETKKNGGRVISVGTTSTRTLESVAEEDGTLHAKSGWTDIFIYPGYKFKVIDGLITNFHLPESTLLMLVSALAGSCLLYTSYVDSEFFKVDRYELTGKNVIQNDNPFMMVSITEGSGTLEENKVKKGDHFVICSDQKEVIFDGTMGIMISTL